MTSGDHQSAPTPPVASSSPASSIPEAAKLLLAGGLSGVLAKTATAPLGRLTILYQVQALQGTSPCSAGAGYYRPLAMADIPSVRVMHRLVPVPEAAAAAMAAAAGPSGSMGAVGMGQQLGRQLPLMEAVQHIVRTEGVLSLWKGNLATVLHRLPYSAVNFATFELMDERLKDSFQSAPARRFAAGAVAGLAGCVAAYPLDLLRTRLAAQTECSPYRYHGMLHAASRIVSEEGVAGLYRGLGATVAQVAPSLACHFMFYASIKDMLSSQALQDARLPGLGRPDAGLGGAGERGGEGSGASGRAESGSGAGQRSSEGAGSSGRQGDGGGGGGWSTATVAAAGLASVCTSTITFPLDKVRRLIQVQGAQGRGIGGRQLGMWETGRDIWRRGGVRAFYEGIAAEYVKVVPGMIVAFATFEALKDLLGVQQQQQQRRRQELLSQAQQELAEEVLE